MTMSVWARVRVTQVTPGATHESEVFDQYVSVVTPEGITLEMFDMAPMMGQGLGPGVEVWALILLDPYAGLGPGGADGTVLAAPAVSVQREELPNVRPEVFDRSWAVVAFRGTLPLLLSPARAAGLAAGTPVGWQKASHVLMGWRPA